jgi:hypothetical protein
MKKLFVLILITGQTLFANQWHQCLDSYRPSASPIIDIRFGSVASRDYMIFRNGNHFTQEELNIFYKGKFWKAPLEITQDFYQKKTMSVRLGEDRLCFKRNFKWILTDRSELSAFNQAECGDAEVITLREDQPDRHPTAAEVLEYKLEKDVKFQAECVAGRAEGGCRPETRREDFERLQRWNTDSCEPISSLSDIISLRTEAVQIFNTQAAATTPN